MDSKLDSIREVLSKPLPSAHNVEGFCSLHPIMRVMPTRDRRICVRRHVIMPATVAILGRALPATMLDISRTGCRLSGLHHARLRDAVSVHLADNVLLKGIVVWTDEDHAGIRFERLT